MLVRYTGRYFEVDSILLGDVQGSQRAYFVERMTQGGSTFKQRHEG